MYKSPKVEHVCWGDSFKVRRHISNKENETIFEINKTYTINGLGKKFIDGKPYKCWSIVSGIDEMIIPIETINKLFEKGIINKL